MIEVQQLTKKYGEKTVVDHLEFTVRPGIVTGFLGPNGAGKSTTMRMIVGLDRPTAARSGCAAGGEISSHGPVRVQPSPGAGRDPRHPDQPGA